MHSGPRCSLHEFYEWFIFQSNIYVYIIKISYFTVPVQVDLQSPWWMEALHDSAAKGLEGDLCHRIKDELSSTDMELGSIGR